MSKSETEAKPKTKRAPADPRVKKFVDGVEVALSNHLSVDLPDFPKEVLAVFRKDLRELAKEVLATAPPAAQ